MRLFPVEKRFFDYKGTRMSYFRRNGQYPLVLIHGFTASSDIWLPLVEKLDQRFDLVIVDLFGHGSSGMPKIPDGKDDIETIIAFQASAITALIESLGFMDFGLIGSSLGGWVSMELAVRHMTPSGLILIDTAGVVPLSDTDFKVGFSLLLQLYNEQENELTPILNKIISSGDVNSTIMDKSLVSGADFRIVVLWGTEDPVLKIDYGKKFSEELRNSSFTPIPNAGHTPFTTNPEDVARVVNNFFH